VDTLLVDRLGLDGAGIASGRRLPFALPGERWDVSAEPPRLVAASPERVAPPCRHFGVCGGCALQHASDGFVARWKREAVVRALAGQRLDAEVLPTLTSPAHSRRRAVLAGRRTRRTLLVGFHGGRTDTLVDIEECPVLRPEILAAKPALAALVRIAASRSAGVRLTVVAGPAGLDVDLAEARAPDVAVRGRAADVAAAFDLARLSWDGEILAERRVPFQVMGPARVVPPPAAFLQATAEGEAALLAAVERATAGARRVADLFAGCGTFALPLAARAEVRAVEGDAAMVAALAEAWRRTPRLRRLTAERRDLFRRPLLAHELAGLDAVVIDPPRAGAEAQVKELARAELGRISMVSCNPVTFARDARLLVERGWRLGWVQPVDQFRWSAHVELAAAFERG
jgi:23S rRNA (uracil1939-C5)-methyltransferase